jgi:putative NIF3 family GTP cyclohydrolase 1 type 2
MATVVTYLLVSNPDDPEAVRVHPTLEDHNFELHPMEEKGEGDTLPALRFAVASALEDRTSLEVPCKQLSSDFPEATVTLCEVEERFDQVEHLRSVVFIGGRRAGEIEHGYVLNVGT